MGRLLTAGLVFSLAGLLAAGRAAAADDSAERRGCCSHHRGVCGCKDERAVCCDGALSPTCGCD
ncbi:MAG TPA: hypothetical protein VMI54_25115 [Polyangiaceae bacterium]|nr:hypothetical protein [Polyangiaceae bacterium]